MQEYGFKDILPAQKALSKVWLSMSESSKKPYYDLMDKDITRYIN